LIGELASAVTLLVILLLSFSPDFGWKQRRDAARTKAA
jgi:hypothetical protein